MNLEASYSMPPLPLWESKGRLRRPFLEKDAEAKLRLCRIVRCDPGEGLRSIDRPEPLTPTLSHIEVGYIRLRQFEMPISGKPEMGGRGGSPPLLRHRANLRPIGP